MISTFCECSACDHPSVRTAFTWAASLCDLRAVCSFVRWHYWLRCWWYCWRFLLVVWVILESWLPLPCAAAVVVIVPSHEGWWQCACVLFHTKPSVAIDIQSNMRERERGVESLTVLDLSLSAGAAYFKSTDEVGSCVGMCVPSTARWPVWRCIRTSMTISCTLFLWSFLLCFFRASSRVSSSLSWLLSFASYSEWWRSWRGTWVLTNIRGLAKSSTGSGGSLHRSVAGPESGGGVGWGGDAHPD